MCGCYSSSKEEPEKPTSQFDTYLTLRFTLTNLIIFSSYKLLQRCTDIFNRLTKGIHITYYAR